jgi:heparan-alpha-glucosaminide N-acetyltransferase
MTTLATHSAPQQIADRPAERETPTAAALPREKPARLQSLDAYRGAIMLFMASGGLALPQVAKQFPDSPVWRFLAFNTEHVPWVGCSLWDLIQPSFMFMVGVAMPYSIASRQARGDSEKRIAVHVLYRALVLVLLAVFLYSERHRRTNFVFTNVLGQIGLGYAFLYPLLGRGMRVQVTALAGILIGYWLLFLLWPLPAEGAVSYHGVGESYARDWAVNYPSWFAHWDKHTNAAAAFDRWFLNLFPRDKPFQFEGGGYQTLNFVPSLGTMILGLMAGETLRRPTGKWRKFGRLLAAASICLALGWLAGEFVCPIVKRIWTPSWVLFSAGWTFTMLAGFFWVIDIVGWRRWAFPLVVVGMNSIAMYLMAQLLPGWIARSLQIHLGPLALPSLTYLVTPVVGWMNGPVDLDPVWLNNTFGPIVQSAAVLFVLWLICLWMYRRGVFLRI